MKMKYVKCFFGDKTKYGFYRITHDKIYEVYSREKCGDKEFWIICDNGSIARFCLSYLIEDIKPHEFGFIDVTAEIMTSERDSKLNKILNEYESNM